MRKIAKIGVMGMALSMLFSVSAFAAQTRPVDYDESFSTSYRDSYNVTHYVTGTASVSGTVGWDEGYSGWVISANFPKPNVAIDGSGVSVEFSGNTVKSGSIAYQDFKINASSHMVRPTLSCDEYGDTSFYVRSW